MRGLRTPLFFLQSRVTEGTSIASFVPLLLRGSFSRVLFAFPPNFEDLDAISSQ